MNQEWMTENRARQYYRNYVKGFTKLTLTDMRDTEEKIILCSCHNCENCIYWDNIVETENTLFIRCFKKGYTCWTNRDGAPTMVEGNKYSEMV